MDVNKIILSLDTDEKKKKYFLNNNLSLEKLELTKEQDEFFFDLMKKHYKDLSGFQMIKFRAMEKGSEWFIRACESPEFIKDLFSGKKNMSSFVLEFPGLENKLENFHSLVDWEYPKGTTMPIPNHKKIKGYNYLKSSLVLLDKASNDDLAKAYLNNRLLPMEKKIMTFLINLDFHQKLLKEKSELLPNDPINHRAEKKEIVDFFANNPRWSNLRKFKRMYWNIVVDEEHWSSFSYFDKYNEFDSVKYPLTSFAFFEKALGKKTVNEMFFEALLTLDNNVNYLPIIDGSGWNECVEKAHFKHFKKNYNSSGILSLDFADDSNLSSLVSNFIKRSVYVDNLSQYDEDDSAIANKVINGYIDIKNKPVVYTSFDSTRSVSFNVADNPLQIVLRMKSEHMKDFYPYMVAALIKDEIDFNKNPPKNYHLFDLKKANGSIPIESVTSVLMGLTLEENIEIHQQIEKDMKQKILPHAYLKMMMISDVLNKNSIDTPSDENQSTMGFKI